MSIEIVTIDEGMKKADIKAAKKDFQDKLAGIQHMIKESKISVVVLIEGMATSGKGLLINEFLADIDPRFTSTLVLNSSKSEIDEYPFMYKFYNALPSEGEILFVDGGWYHLAVDRYMEGKIDRRELNEYIRDINYFERTLVNNGYVLLKLFINISRKTQLKHIKKLEADKNNSWRLSQKDYYQNNNFEKFYNLYYLLETHTDHVPWHVINGESKSELLYGGFKTLYETIENAINSGKYCGEPYEEEFPMSDPVPSLESVDLSLSISDEEYRKQLKKLQKKIGKLTTITYRKKIPVVICYEGWDAAGKGGNIRRLSTPLDPRSSETYPISSPVPPEKTRHFLWRFWNKIPKRGFISIFDRTWYGRVMVERIEGFCSENDWKRAYNEINEFEQQLYDWGAVVIKFWLHIDQGTQFQRFSLRQNTPEKQWKITDEDWRNREKWPQYEQAVNEMLKNTSTTFAPWHIIESNDKKYARIKALKIVADTLEEAIKKAD